MTVAGEEQRTAATPRVGDQHGTRPCATCRAEVDPLRAARVAIFDDRFHYFCSAACRERFTPGRTRTPLPEEGASSGRIKTPAQPAEQPALRADPETPRTVPAEFGQPPLEAAKDADGPSDLEQSDLEQDARTDQEALPSASDAPALGSLLLALGAVASWLAIALALAGDSSVAMAARLALVFVGCAAVAAETLLGHREPTDIHPFALLAGPIGSSMVALAAFLSGASQASSAINLSALIIASGALMVLTVRRVALPIELERQLIETELEGPCLRVTGEEATQVRSADLRPGEEIIVETGEVVPVDASVTAGAAVVSPWRGAACRAEKTKGDVVVAGARVLEGRVRAVVGWTGHDRAWIRLSNDPQRRADLRAGLSRSGRIVSERLSGFAAGAAALAAFAGEISWVELGMLLASVQAALASPAVTSLPALWVSRAVFEGLRRGIAFRTAESFDRAAKVSTVTFCARGTVLLGEPEVANIDAFGSYRPHEVLALVAGAESGARHAIGSAVLRAARARGVRPDGVRSPTALAGLGTTAVASNGQALVVGSRALMLREHVSVAAAENLITDHEAAGQSVLLVALGGRLVGLLALQDGLRPGARASVQHLLDVGVEPVLLSGDARETCEALGRALDVDHIRPEVPPAERGDAIRRLSDGGAVVAVVGHSPVDDVALGAADVSIALHAAGSTTSEWHVQLASDDVRDAAFAIRLSRDARRETRIALLLGLAPAAVGSLLATLGLAPAAVGPAAALLGGLFAVLRFRFRNEPWHARLDS